MNPIQEKEIRWVFIISIIIKGINASFEFIIGISLLFTGNIARFVNVLVQKELIEDPNDFFATSLNNFLPYFISHTQLFGALYLIGHGIVKIFLVWGLLKNKLWAYPTSIVFLSFFILYQLIRFSFTHSIFLILLTIFDLLVLWLVWHEYKYRSK